MEVRARCVACRRSVPLPDGDEPTPRTCGRQQCRDWAAANHDELARLEAREQQR